MALVKKHQDMAWTCPFVPALNDFTDASKSKLVWRTRKSNYLHQGMVRRVVRWTD
jgi:hypothetical protein